MAIVRATKSGNWSDTTVWNTGALPTAADDVYSNTFTVTIDQSVTVLQISNAAATGVTAGGGFVMSAGGYTLTANVNSSLTVTCLTVSNGAGTTATVVGNVQAGSTGRGIIFSGAGTLNITGNVNAGTASTSKGVEVTSTGTCNITGNCTAGNGNTAHGVDNMSTGTVNITGSVTAGSNSGASGAVNSSTGTLSHVGTAQASATTAAIGPGNIGQVTILTGPLLSTTTAQGTAAASGVNPCTALRWFPADTALSTFSYTMRGATVSGGIRPERTMYLPDAYASGQPTPANVRSGTIYGPDNIYTGTCAVPGASSVLSGVPVDNTTGTATISAADIRAAVGLASANLDAQFAAIPAAPSAATIRTEMDSNSTKLANLDATISSRLPSSSYQAPLDAAGTRSAVGLASSNLDTQLSGISSGVSGLPSAAAIATAVWAAATRTLTTAIDNSATIAAAVWSYATGRTITGGTVDTLTNAPSVPSAAAIASQVRTELTPELARVSNAATTQEVADIVEGAVNS